MLLCGTMEIGLSDTEQVARRMLIVCRCVHVLILVTASSAFVVGTLWWRLPIGQTGGGALNAAAFLGMAGAAVRGTVPVWLTPALIAGVTYLMGTGSSGSARPWAWLLFADSSALKVVIDAVLFMAGAGLWTASRASTQA